MNIRNHEHYMDTTPYFATRATDPKVGEVYSYKGFNVLIVAVNKTVATILQLNPDEHDDWLPLRGIYWTNVYQIQYAYVDKLGEFQFVLRKNELESVKEAMINAFGLIQEKTTSPTHDVVNHPDHYCPSDGGRECIDEMRLMFGDDAVVDFCRLNVWKYRFRASKKNGEEDLKKAEWYMNKIASLMKGETIK